MKSLKFFVAILMAICLLSVGAMSEDASADTETGTALADLDSQTGMVADTTDYHSASASVAASNADTAKEEVDKFTKLDFEFRMAFEDSTVTNYLQVEIVNDEDSEHTITVKIYPAGTAGASTKVVVDDDYGDGVDASETKVMQLYDLSVGNFALVEIDIGKTASNTDGSKQKIEVSINGTEYIDMDLKGPATTDTNQRSWNQVEWTASMSSTTTVNIDDWDIDTGGSSTYGYAWKVYVIAFVIVAAAVIYYVKPSLGPLSKGGKKTVGSRKK